MKFLDALKRREAQMNRTQMLILFVLPVVVCASSCRSRKLTPEEQKQVSKTVEAGYDSAVEADSAMRQQNNEFSPNN